MKLTSTAFPDGTRIDHNKQDVDVAFIVADYRDEKKFNKQKQISKLLIKQAEMLNLNTRTK